MGESGADERPYHALNLLHTPAAAAARPPFRGSVPPHEEWRALLGELPFFRPSRRGSLRLGISGG